EEAPIKEVKKKSLRDFYKTHPSGSGTIAKDPPSVEKITPTVTSEGTGNKPGVLDVTKDDSTESESESWGNDEDDSNNEQESSNDESEPKNDSEEQASDSEQEEESDYDDQEEEEFVHTPSPTDDKDDDNLESESDDVSKGDEEMDDTTNQFDDDVDARLKEHTQTDKEIVQGPVASSSLSSDLASKFLNISDIPQADAEIISPLDVYVHHEVPRTKVPTLLSVPVSAIPESSPVFTNIPQSSHTFTPTPIQTTPTPSPTIETTNPLSNLLDFALILMTRCRKVNHIGSYPNTQDCYACLKKSYDLDKDFFFSYDVYSLKRDRKDKDKDEDPSAGSDRGLKKRKLSKDAEPTTEPKKKTQTWTHDQEGNLGDNEDEPRNKTTSRRDWFKKPTPPQGPTDPDWNVGKTTQEGPTQKWLMTLVASTSSGKSLKDFDELMSTHRLI
ncbi:hypothetical protein Tco_0915023, partial [Tanacetum coccineum]